MTYTVQLKPSGYTFTVTAEETVLAAALRQGYRMPYHCADKSCGACKGQLLEGQVYYDEPVTTLSDDEREAGLALLCCAKPESDLLIHIDGVTATEPAIKKKLTYHVSQIELLSGDVYRVMLRAPLEDSLNFRAGQYLEILHRDTSPRPFSIASAPRDDNQLELHIRYLADNPFTIELLEEIKTTKQLRVVGPFGQSYYRSSPALPMILLAGGTGFAHLKAIVEQAYIEKFSLPIYFYWGARTSAELYLHDLVQEWMQLMPNFYYVPVLSAAPTSDNWKGRTGLVHEAVLVDHPDLANYHIYASGPPEMVYAALRAFQSHGLNRALMYSDWFDYEAK